MFFSNIDWAGTVWMYRPGGCNLVPESVPLFSLGPHRRQCKIRARVLVGLQFGISSLYILYYNLFGTAGGQHCISTWHRQSKAAAETLWKLALRWLDIPHVQHKQLWTCLGLCGLVGKALNFRSVVWGSILSTEVDLFLFAPPSSIQTCSKSQNRVLAPVSEWHLAMQWACHLLRSSCQVWLCSWENLILGTWEQHKLLNLPASLTAKKKEVRHADFPKRCLTFETPRRTPSEPLSPTIPRPKPACLDNNTWPDALNMLGLPVEGCKLAWSIIGIISCRFLGCIRLRKSCSKNGVFMLRHLGYTLDIHYSAQKVIDMKGTIDNYWCSVSCILFQINSICTCLFCRMNPDQQGEAWTDRVVPGIVHVIRAKVLKAACWVGFTSPEPQLMAARPELYLPRTLLFKYGQDAGACVPNRLMKHFHIQHIY